jgi:hypothetical protein
LSLSILTIEIAISNPVKVTEADIYSLMAALLKYNYTFT